MLTKTKSCVIQAVDVCFCGSVTESFDEKNQSRSDYTFVIARSSDSSFRQQSFFGMLLLVTEVAGDGAVEEQQQQQYREKSEKERNGRQAKHNTTQNTQTNVERVS